MDEAGAQARPAVTATNHSAYIVITIALSLVCTLLFLGIRLAVRRPWKRLFMIDDWATLMASMFALCQSIVVLFGAKVGLGKVESELSPERVEKALKLLYASDLLYMPTIFIGQLAVSLFFLRLSGPNRTFFHRLARLITGASMLLAMVCLLMVAIRVDHGMQVWDIMLVGHKTILYRWIAAGVLSILIEVLLIICPAWLLWTLQMPLNKKLGCSVYFGIRFPTVILTVLRLTALVKASQGSDRTFDMTMPLVLTQLEMQFTVLAATIPILRNPLTKLNSGYLNTTLEQMDPAASAAYAASRSSGSGKGHSYTLSHITANRRHDNAGLGQRGGQGIKTTAEGGSDSVEERGSVLSEGSDKIIIKRTVKIDYA